MTTLTQISDGRAGVHALIERAEAADGSRRADFFYQAGLLAECWGGEPGWALELYVKALWLVPGHAAALDAVIRLVDDPSGQVAAALEAEQLLEVGGGRYRTDLLCARAERRFHTGDLRGSAQDLDRALQMQMSHRRARLILQDIQVIQSDHAALRDNVRETAQASLDKVYRGALFGLAGKLGEDFIGDHNAAGTDLRFAAEADPEQVGYQVAAERCARLSGDLESLAARLEDEATNRPTAKGRLAAAIDAAAVNAWCLDRASKGADILAHAVRNAEEAGLDSVDVLLARELLLLVSRSSNRLAALRELALKLESPGRQASAFTEIASELLEGRDTPGAEEVNVAIRYLRAALDAYPGYRPATAQLELLYQSSELAAEQRELLRQRAEEQVRPDLLIEAAEVTLGELGREDEAIALLRRAVALSDEVDLFGPQSALDRLVAVQTEAGDDVGCRQAIVDALERIETPQQRQRLLSLLAEFHEPGTDEALQALSDAFQADPTDIFAAERLVAALVARGDWSAVVDLRAAQHDAHATQQQDDRALDARLRIAQVCEGPLAQTERALMVYQEVLERRPLDRAATYGVIHCLTRLERWDELVVFYQDQVQRLEKSPQARLDQDVATLNYQVALLAERWHGDLDLAADFYQRVLAVSPHHLPSVSGSLRVARAQDDWPHVAEMLGVWADNEADRVVEAAVRFELGEVCENHLGEMDRACAAYEAALELEPKLEAAAMGLIRAHYSAGRVNDAIAALKRRATTVSDPERREMLLAMVLLSDDEEEALRRVAAEYPGDSAVNIALLRHALADGDPHEGAAAARRVAHELGEGPLRSAMFRLGNLLEQLSGAGLDFDSAHQMLNQGQPSEQTLLRLEAWFRAQGDLEGLAEIMKLRAEAARDDLTRAAYFLAYGRFLQSRGRTNDAIDVYQKVLEERPGFLPALKALKFLQELAGDREGLAVTCEREGAQVQDVDLAVHDFLTAGMIRRRYLGDVDGAVFDLETVLKLRPDNPKAFETLREIYSMRGDARALYHLLARRAEALTDMADSKELLLMMAEIAYSRLSDDALAIRCHQRVLELDPCHIQSYRILAEIYETNERWDDALDALVGVLGLTENKNLLALTYRSIAEIYDNHLEDDGRAIEAYRSLLKNDPNNIPVLRRLAELLKESERWEAAAKAYGSLLQRERKRANLKLDLLALADICLRGLGDAVRAEQCLAQAVKLDPYDAEIHQAAVDHYQSQGQDTKLAEHYLASLRVVGARVVEGLGKSEAELRTSVAEDLEGPLASLFELARMYKDPDRAFVAASLAVHFDVANEEAENFHNDVLRHPVPVARNPIPIDMTDVALPTRLAGAFLSVLRATEPVVQRLFPASLKTYGGSRRTRLSERDTRPGASTVVLWPTIFSVPDVTVHVTDHAPSVPVAEHTDPTALFLREEHLERVATSDPELMLLLGRALAPWSMGLGAWMRLPHELFMSLFAAVMQTWVPTFLLGADGTIDRRVDPERVQRAVNRLGDQGLMPAVYEITGKYDLGAIIEQRKLLHYAFTRLATVPVFDPGPCLGLAQREGGRAAAADLAVLILGDRYTHMRTAVGVALKDG